MNNNTSLPLALELPVLFTARNITALTIAEDYYVMEVKRCLTAIEEKIGQQLFDVLEIEYIEILFQHGCILDQTLFQRFQHIKDNLEKQQSIGLYKDARIHSDTLSRLEYFLWAVDK
jgi:hypothetical protein